MNEILTGGCLCKNVQYECENNLIIPLYCHCRDCQLAHSAPYALEVSVPKESFEYIKGKANIYSMKGDSGSLKYYEFCSNCGTPLLAWTESFPEIRMLQIAALKNPNMIHPVAHVYTKSAINLESINDNFPRFEGLPEIDELLNLINPPA